MINTLSIRNYGSNKRVDIKLNRYVTCITGESYTGKSWILRALRCIALNKPSGISCINWDAEKYRITTRIGKNKIRKERSKTINVYFINDRKLEAFGRNNVPDSVSKLFNLSSINFQKQQEMPHGEGPLFWFALTPGQVSKRLNQIVNLELIDTTLANLQSESRSAKSILDICRSRKKEAKQKVKELAFIEQMNQEWEIICKLSKRIETHENKIKKLRRLIYEITLQQTTIDKMKLLSEEMERELQELETLRATIIKTEEQVLGLTSAIAKVKYAKKYLLESKKELKVAERNYKKAFGERCPLCLRK